MLGAGEAVGVQDAGGKVAGHPPDFRTAAITARAVAARGTRRAWAWLADVARDTTSGRGNAAWKFGGALPISRTRTAWRVVCPGAAASEPRTMSMPSSPGARARAGSAWYSGGRVA